MQQYKCVWQRSDTDELKNIFENLQEIFKTYSWSL